MTFAEEYHARVARNATEGGHHALIPLAPKDQLSAFTTPIEVTSGPLGMDLHFQLERVRRQRCAVCGKRRIGLRIALGPLVSPAMCAKCAGAR